MGAPRGVVLHMSVSIDGYFEGPGRDIDWHTVDDELLTHMNDTLRTRGAFLQGRVMHELMAGYWPEADADPDAPAPTAEFAGIWRDMPKYVFSRTLPAGPADWNTTVLHQVDPARVRALREEADGDLVVGGAGLASSFYALDLIDAYDLYVHPVLVGGGRHLLSEVTGRRPEPGGGADGGASGGLAAAPRHMRLTGTRTFGSGVVLLQYERTREDDRAVREPVTGI